MAIHVRDESDRLRNGAAMSERIRRTADGTYPDVGEDLAKLDARAAASSSELPRVALALISRGDIAQPEDEILAVWNNHDVTWELPGGREEAIDGGRLEKTSRRALREELGIETFFPTLSDAPPDEPSRVRHVHIFEAVLTTGETPRAAEPYAPIRWFSRK